MKKIELLSPAGDFDKLKTAITYGADAVYVGGEEYSLRSAATNFGITDLERAAEEVHRHGKKLFLTANIIPHNSDIDEYKKYLREIKHISLDGIIISDLGMFEITKALLPEVKIHISTQANNTNYASVNAWRRLGAERVILARELSLAEIGEIRRRTEIELEVFVHGAMCISYSGRCLLSSYMANRDGNGGNCAQPCRWKYHVMEELRPGEYMNVYENERGTYIFNSKDLCMVNHVDKLIECGLTSLKLEGRVKNEYYTAVVTSVYRDAIDTYYKDPDGFTINPDWMNELKKVSHRDYTTGFYFEKAEVSQAGFCGMADVASQNYESNSYIREYNLVGVVINYDIETKLAKFVLKNRIYAGDTIEIIRPDGKFFSQKINRMFDGNGIEITVANRPQSVIGIEMEQEVVTDSIIRIAVRD